MSSSSGSSSSGSSSGSGVRWSAAQPAIAEGGTPVDNGQQRRRQRQRQRRIRIEDDPMASPVKRGLQRVDTKAEFKTVLDVDGEEEEEEEEEEDGEEEEAIGLEIGEQQPNPPPAAAATQEPTAPLAGAAAQQEQQQQPPQPEGVVAPPASLPVSSDPGPGSKPVAPLPPQLPPPGMQPRTILKKTSSYALPPMMNGNGSSGATSGSQPPPIPMPKKTQRTLSFADELGRDLHSVHMAHNTQYSMQGYRRREPVECCTVS